MKSKSILRRLEQLEKKALPPKPSGRIVIFVQPGEVVDYSQYEGCDELVIITDDRLPE